MGTISIGTTLTIPWTSGPGNIILKFVGNNTFQLSSDTPATDSRVQRIMFSSNERPCKAYLTVTQERGRSDIQIDCSVANSVETNVYNGGSAFSDSGRVIDSGNASSTFNP